MTKPKNKKNFAGFNLKEAMQHLGIEKLHPWPLETKLRPPSQFFIERLERLRIFDTARTERAKELLVDAYCEESLINFPDLKLWKAAPLSADDVTGVVDYLLTPQRDYIDTPLLCVVEAKKDDFEQGLAQSLVEMHACQQLNAQQGRHHPLYAIVTNGDGWRFYRYEAGQVYESDLYTRTGNETLLGILDEIFALCQQNRSISAQ